MRHKMINLCPTTFEIASKMKNFSGWVRKELMKIHSINEAKEYKRFRCPACFKIFVDKQEWGEMNCMNRDCGYIHKLEELE